MLNLSSRPFLVEIHSAGRKLPQYVKDKNYIEMPTSGTYSIKLFNRDKTRRALCVITVDGLNILDGQPGSYEQQGYVLNAGAHGNITGWRRTSSEVAAFECTPPEESYSVRMGKGQENVGVIGVAVFYEEPLRYKTVPRMRKTSGSLQAGGSVGTGYGKVEEFHTKETTFRRRSSIPDELLVFHYETHDALLAMGVITKGPNPFPATTVAVPAPPGWTPQ